MKHLRVPFLAVASLIATSTQAQVTVPEGLNPGDTYRLMFATTTLTDAFNTDVAYYDGIVRNEVAMNADLAALDTTWYAMVGVQLVPGGGGADRIHPRIRLEMNWEDGQTDPATGEPIPVYTPPSGGIWTTGGDLIAPDYATIFSNAPGAIAVAITATVDGTPFDSANGGPRVWTGMQGLGWASGGALGNADCSRGVARDDILNGGAFNAGLASASETYRLYAISEMLTVPEGGPTWAGYTIDENGWVNTGDWLGWVFVNNAPYNYILSLDSWMFMSEEAVGTTGAWAYIFSN
jgi:hypothetical protein